jgi:hypothetical protein
MVSGKYDNWKEFKNKQFPSLATVSADNPSINLLLHEGESVNRSQMDIKCKTYDIRNWKKHFISRHVLHQHGYTCLIALPGRQSPQHRSVLTVVSVTSAPPFQPLRHQRNVCHTVVNRFTWQIHTSHRKQETFLYEYRLHWVLLPTQKKTHNRTLLFSSTFKHGHHFDYWKQPLNMSMRVWYLDCHEVWLCCYLVIHIENLLHPL